AILEPIGGKYKVESGGKYQIIATFDPVPKTEAAVKELCENIKITAQKSVIEEKGVLLWESSSLPFGRPYNTAWKEHCHTNTIKPNDDDFSIKFDSISDGKEVHYKTLNFEVNKYPKYLIYERSYFLGFRKNAEYIHYFKHIKDDEYEFMEYDIKSSTERKHVVGKFGEFKDTTVMEYNLGTHIVKLPFKADLETNVAKDEVTISYKANRDPQIEGSWVQLREPGGQKFLPFRVRDFDTNTDIDPIGDNEYFVRQDDVHHIVVALDPPPDDKEDAKEVCSRIKLEVPEDKVKLKGTKVEVASYFYREDVGQQPATHCSVLPGIIPITDEEFEVKFTLMSEDGREALDSKTLIFKAVKKAQKLSEAVYLSPRQCHLGYESIVSFKEDNEPIYEKGNSFWAKSGDRIAADEQPLHLCIYDEFKITGDLYPIYAARIQDAAGAARLRNTPPQKYAPSPCTSGYSTLLQLNNDIDNWGESGTGNRDSFKLANDDSILFICAKSWLEPYIKFKKNKPECKQYFLFNTGGSDYFAYSDGEFFDDNSDIVYFCVDEINIDDIPKAQKDVRKVEFEKVELTTEGGGALTPADDGYYHLGININYLIRIETKEEQTMPFTIDISKDVDWTLAGWDSIPGSIAAPEELDFSSKYFYYRFKDWNPEGTTYTITVKSLDDEAKFNVKITQSRFSRVIILEDSKPRGIPGGKTGLMLTYYDGRWDVSRAGSGFYNGF
ncbi:hypothetical protein ACFLYT_02090, partial [Nanoarchaeota archaeon]